jgi:hypothetical protein
VVAARVGITIVLPATSTLGLTQALVLPLMPVPALEVRIRTNIMGMANYQIAQMLGKATGPQPEPVPSSSFLPITAARRHHLGLSSEVQFGQRVALTGIVVKQ